MLDKSRTNNYMPSHYDVLPTYIYYMKNNKAPKEIYPNLTDKELDRDIACLGLPEIDYTDDSVDKSYDQEFLDDLDKEAQKYLDEEK